jgi:MFS family permease
MSAAFSAFALAYGIFEIPMGWWSDRVGARRVLIRIVAGWSVFTMLTGAVHSFGSLIATRFAFGAAEAGAFPTLSRALAGWFPASARATVNGVMWMGARFGGAVAPALAAAAIGFAGWRLTFVLFGLVGFVWCAAFARWYREAAAPDAAVHDAAPWRSMFASPNAWALFFAYFAASFGFYFFMTWMPTYLMREHGLSLARSGLYASFPLGAATLACLAGGTLADWLVRRTGSVRRGRAIVGVGGFTLGALGFAAASQSQSALAAVLWLGAAQASLDLTTSVAWATSIDIGGRYGSTMAGFMNTASSIAAVMLPPLATALEREFGTFHAVFALAAGIYFAGGLLWLYIDPGRKVI